jgi:hypothetical protein
MRVDSNLPPELRTWSVAAGARAQTFSVTNETNQPLTAGKAQALLAKAWEAVVGGAAPPQGVALLTAHWALETDAGRSMPGHNFGGIKAAESAAGKSFRTVEGHGPARREVSARFRVYDSAESGAHDYVRLLADRYPAALEAARAGNVASFASALAAGAYFTADPKAYRHGLEQRLAELDQTAQGSLAHAPARFSQGALWGLLRALQREAEES